MLSTTNIFNKILLFLIALICLLIINKDYFKKDNSKTIDIIVSRYNEDLKWTLNKPFNKFKYIVYNKGTNENFEKSHVKKIINLNNVGREGHTYLYHIINNYTNLADINIFFPGSLEIKYKMVKARNILYKVLKYNKAFMRLTYVPFVNKILSWYKHSEYKNTSKFNSATKNTVKMSKYRPYGKWYTKFFNNRDFHYLSNLGIFSVDKRDIIQHPISHYQKIIEELNDDSNPEGGYFLEISIYPLFYPLKYTIIELNYIDNLVYLPHGLKILPDIIKKNYMSKYFIKIL